MRVINFSHPLTQRAIRQIADFYEDQIDVVTVRVQVDLNDDLDAQAAELVAQAGVSRWDITPFVVAGLSPIAVAMLPHMRSASMTGGLDMIVLKRREDTLTPEFELGQVVHLQF